MSAVPAIAQAGIDLAVVAERRRIVGILGRAGRSPELVLMARQCIATGLSVADAGRLMATAPHASNRGFWDAIAAMVNRGAHLVQPDGDGGVGR